MTTPRTNDGMAYLAFDYAQLKAKVEKLETKIAELEKNLEEECGYLDDTLPPGKWCCYYHLSKKLKAVADGMEEALKKVRSFVSREVNSGAAPWYVEECAERRYLLDVAIKSYQEFKEKES